MQESVKEHFENRSQARAGSRITTDRYSKLAPKALFMFFPVYGKY